jgi:hypothetical protein
MEIAMHRHLLSVLLLLVLAQGAALNAQILTGSLLGTVNDQTGAALPGALVRVSSEALVAGTETRSTDVQGRFVFTHLPPGVYAISIEMPGFTRFDEPGVRIGVGQSAERRVALRVAGITETVSVTGDSDLEAQRTGYANRFGSDYLQSIPVRRFSMFDFMKASPGISPQSPSGSNNALTAFGSGANENAFLLDGTPFTCPCSGGAAPQPDVDVIEEVQVVSLGAPAEYGNVQGAVFNVVTKQGGNTFAHDASFYWQADRLASHPTALPCNTCSVPQSRYRRDAYRDVTIHSGGPLARNRVWFFAGYQHLRDASSQPGTDPMFPQRSEVDKLFAKLTSQLTPRLRLMNSFHNEFWVDPDRPTIVQPYETTLRSEGSRPTATFGHLTHVVGNSAVWEARVAQFRAPEETRPVSGNRTTPQRIDQATGIVSGNGASVLGLRYHRTTAAASLSYFITGLPGGSHMVKAGVQIEQGAHDQNGGPTGGATYTDNAGVPFQVRLRDPFVNGGAFNTGGVFLDDVIRVASRLTLNVGVRYDHTRAVSPDLHRYDAEGRKTSTRVKGLGTLYTWNDVSPRLGASVRLTADGRTVARASYGRYHQGVLTGELAPVHPGLTPVTTARWDPATGEYSRIISVVDSTVNLRHDPHTRSPYTDQFSATLERELWRHLTVTAGYVKKDGRDFIGWTDTGGVYVSQTRTLPDGRTIPVFSLTNSTADRRFLLTNPEGYFLEYNGLLITADKRWASGWQAFASYTYGQTLGLQASSNATPSGVQNSSTLGSGAFGRDPNSLTNARGREPADRTHILRVMGSTRIPLVGVNVAANLQHFTGKPWAATALVSLPQGQQRIMLEPRGTRTLSSQTLFDLRISRSFPLDVRARIELLADVLNALNDQAEVNVATDNFFSPNFARPSSFISPRQAMLGARLTWGR